MLERKLPQMSSGEADKLIDKAAEFLVKFMAEFNATHHDPDAHELRFTPSLVRVPGSAYGIGPYFEQLCSLTLASQYVIVPDEQSYVSPTSVTPASSQRWRPTREGAAES